MKKIQPSFQLLHTVHIRFRNKYRYRCNSIFVYGLRNFFAEKSLVVYYYS